MTFFDRLKNDNRRILSSDDMHDLILFDASNNQYTGKGRFTAPGMQINANGQMINTKKWTIAFHTDSFLPVITVTENFKNWQGQFINSEGETIKGVFNNQWIDKTFGYVVANLTENKVESV